MRNRTKSLSASPRFSAIILLVAYFSVVIPAAVEYSHYQSARAAAAR